jgi:hypothetical protein
MMHNDASPNNDCERQSVKGSLDDVAPGSGGSSEEEDDAKLGVSERLRVATAVDDIVIVGEADQGNSTDKDARKVAQARGLPKGKQEHRSRWDSTSRILPHWALLGLFQCVYKRFSGCLRDCHLLSINIFLCTARGNQFSILTISYQIL